MKDQTETVGDASFIQILHDVMNEGLKTTQMDTRESNLEQEQLITEDEIPCLSYQVPGPGGKQDGNVHDRSELFSTVLNKIENREFDCDDIPPSQAVHDKYLVAIQVRNQDIQGTDMEIFWTTPDQTVGDWIMGRVTMEGSNIQFDAPRIGSKIVSLHERLHQLGDILQLTFKEAKRDVVMLRVLLF